MKLSISTQDIGARLRRIEAQDLLHLVAGLEDVVDGGARSTAAQRDQLAALRAYCVELAGGA